MAKTGRKKIEVDLEEVERLAGLGLTNEEIALSLGIGEATVYRKKNEDDSFDSAIKKGRIKVKREISNVLYDKAIGGDLGSIVWFDKTRLGFSDKVSHEHSGADGGPILLGAVSATLADEELEAWREQKRLQTAKLLNG